MVVITPLESHSPGPTHQLRYSGLWENMIQWSNTSSELNRATGCLTARIRAQFRVRHRMMDDVLQAVVKQVGYFPFTVLNVIEYSL